MTIPPTKHEMEDLEVQMVNGLNLMWAFVFGAFVGMLITSFFTGASQYDREYEAYQKGYRKGARKYMGILEINGCTLGELYNSHKNEFNALIASGEVELLKEDETGQLQFVVFNTYDEFCEYLGSTVVEVSEGSSRVTILIKD